MGDTWIIDMTHYADIRDPAQKVPMPARQIGEFFGLIVSAASSWPVRLIISGCTGILPPIAARGGCNDDFRADRDRA